MKHYLEHCEAKTFTSNEIAESLLGDLVKGSEVTRLLTSLKFSPKKTSIYNPNGNNKSVRLYYTKKVRVVLQKLALHSFSFAQYNQAYFSKSSTKTTTPPTYSTDFNGGVTFTTPKSTHLQSPLLLIFKEYTPEDIELLTNSTAFNFYCYYHLVQALKKIVAVETNGCVTLPEGFKKDKDGYNILDSNLLKYLELAFNIDLFQTRRIHKIVAQVYNPLIDYTYLHCHHLCKNRACISTLCVTIADIKPHNTYHNKARDHHPLNDPEETLQVVKKPILDKPIKPTSNVVPFYKINRHNGVDYTPSLMIDLEDGTAPFKITKLPSSLLHNFKEGFNYKGK